MYAKNGVLIAFFLAGSVVAAEQAKADSERLELGETATGVKVFFTRSASGEWGLETEGDAAPRLIQQVPVKLELFRTEEDIRTLSGGYKSVEVTAEGAEAVAEVAVGDGVRFQIHDRWKVEGAELYVRRQLQVAGNAAGGFYSGLMLTTAPSDHRDSVEFFMPGLVYSAVDSRRTASGPRPAAFREDCLPAPMVSVLLANGGSVTLLNPAPRGDTTDEDIRGRVSTVLIDERFRFGAFGIQAAATGSVEFGYWYPGSIVPGEGATVRPSFRRRGGLRRRYHPIRHGLTQAYELWLRFGKEESFRDLVRNSWRWAWQSLNPPVHKIDVELVRRTLLDHLADRVETIGGRTGITWIFQATTGRRWKRPDDMRVAMGFVGKNLEAADQLLREGDRDKSARGKKMRRLGLAIIDTFVRLIPMSPPGGEAFDLATGELTVSFPPSSWRGNLEAGKRVFIRAPSEDLRRVMEAYRRERSQGREHPEWLQWCRQFCDWLLTQQRPDGSFPRAWRPGTGEVVEPSGSSSYNPVPLLVTLGGETGEPKYLRAATRAAEYIWRQYGDKGAFAGGTLDNPDVIDKEAGMLSLEAFLSLYEATEERSWLRRAESAASFAETWIWIWDVPMAEDSSDTDLHWKKGVPTVGLQGITVRGVGGADQYMDWSTPAYAKLYKYANDPHYLDVARLLLHNTKAMLALPGRTYDLAGPGWQQEHWNLGPRRGYGGHRGWLPWVSTNPLYGITGLEAFDAQLFQQLAEAE